MCFGDGLPFLSLTMVGNKASRDRTDGVMEQRAAANLECSVPAAVGVLESGFRVVQHLAADWVDQQPVGGLEI